MIIFAIIVVLNFSEIPGSAEGDIIYGRSVYEKNCAFCHGEFGKGDGPKSEKFESKPINFTHPDMMKDITPERLERAVVQGLPKLSEHAFGHLLTPEEVKNVTQYVRSLLR